MDSETSLMWHFRATKGICIWSSLLVIDNDLWDFLVMFIKLSNEVWCKTDIKNEVNEQNCVDINA